MQRILSSHYGEAMMKALEVDYQEALHKCQEGKFSEELRMLYRMPYRERVRWDLFPSWARPSDLVEAGHEGGRVLPSTIVMPRAAIFSLRYHRVKTFASPDGPPAEV